MDTEPQPKKPLRILTADLLIADLSVQKNDALVKLLNHYGLKKGGKRSVNDIARTQMGLSGNDDIPADRQEEFANHIKEIYKAFASAADNFQVSPGGSSFNVVAPLCKLLNNDDEKQVDVTFFGVTGDAIYAERIKSALEQVDIKRIPELPEGTKVDTALSIVIKYPPEGPGDTADRTIITFPGNAADVIKPHLITREIVEANDVLLVQGSIWQKLQKTRAVDWGHASEDDLGFADKLLRLRWQTNKDLWLTLPTTAEFNPQSNAHFQELIKSANLILSNDEELSRVYTRAEERQRIESIIAKTGLEVKKKDENDKTPTEAQEIEAGREIMRDREIKFTNVFKFSIEGKAFTGNECKKIQKMRDVLDNRKITEKEFASFNFEHKSIIPETAFDRLEEVLSAKFLESDTAKQHGWKGKTDQAAFITRGKRGAIVLSKDANGSIRLQDIAPVSPKKIEGTLGAGDTSFAGFLAGHIKGLAPAQAAQVGMALACKKLEVSEAQLPNPKIALRDAVIEHKLDARVANAILPAGINGYHELLLKRPDRPLPVLGHTHGTVNPPQR